jgi:hypothetical protein
MLPKTFCPECDRLLATTVPLMILGKHNEYFVYPSMGLEKRDCLHTRSCVIHVAVCGCGRDVGYTYTFPHFETVLLQRDRILVE